MIDWLVDKEPSVPLAVRLSRLENAYSSALCFCGQFFDAEPFQSSPILNYEYWVRSGSQFLGSQPAGDISHKRGGRLPLLSTRRAISFPAKEITLIGRYQIILLGDRGTQV